METENLDIGQAQTWASEGVSRFVLALWASQKIVGLKVLPGCAKLAYSDLIEEEFYSIIVQVSLGLPWRSG